jgi:hypothetical protein
MQEKKEMICPVCSKKMKRKPAEFEDYSNCDYWVCLDTEHKVEVTVKV